MEIQKTSESQIPMPLRPMLQLTFIRHLENNNYKGASDSMPRTVTLATKEPPICDVIKVIGRLKVVIFVKLELIKLSERISVSGNLNESQLEFISTQLVEMFPNESLADFKICFERGCIGQYGEIFRMDGIVLRQWIEKYLEEKYQVIESELMKEKDEHYKKIAPETSKDWYKVWLESIGADPKVPAMSREDVLKYGQSEPVRKSATDGYKYFKVKNVQVLALTQEHAETLVKKMIDIGELEEE